jgi:hypothetical protein
MGAKETNIMNACMVALSVAGCLVWRNNVGGLPDANGRPIRYGLGTGSSDLVGICRDGTFLAVEVKTKTGRVSPAQEAFIAAVRRRGGRSGVARSPEEAVRIARPETG